MTLLNRRSLIAFAAGLGLATAFSLPASAQTTISALVFNNPDNVAFFTEAVKQFEAANPDIKVEIELNPGGADGDNLIKTKLATGEMADVLNYNSGSLFQALNPAKNFLDLTNEPWQADVLDSFKQVVTATDGTVRGAPVGAAIGGGILYNIPIYKELGLSIPKTWADFMANNEKIKAAGKVPVIQSFGATWTSQIFVLADFYNVQKAQPNFAADYTANKAHYGDNPVAMAGFQHGEEVFKAGYLNPDFAAATFEEGVTKVANGDGAHYPMLSFAAGTIKQLVPEKLNDVGFFSMPGPDAATNGLTVWMPNGLYINTNTEHVAEAKKFLAFVASRQGCDILNQTGNGIGAYVVKGCTLPENVPPIVADLLPYFEADGKTSPALEFVSPIKGPALEQITVEVGSGIRSAADGAKLYDEDVKKQAQQLGLPGWN